MKKKLSLSHFQNSVSFENDFGKTGQKPSFSFKSKDAFQKTRTFGSKVLEKPHFIALAFAMFAMAAIIALLFSGCDFLLGKDDNGTGTGTGTCPPHNWTWDITTPQTVTSGGGEEDDEEDDDENYSIGTEICTKCKATGRIIHFPEGSDINDYLNGTDGDVYVPPTLPDVQDDEWQRIIDRVNLLVDNHFENRDFSQSQNANWNITGLSVGIYKNGRTAFFNRGYHESEQRNVARRRPITENSIFAIGSTSKPISSIMLSYFSRNNPATGRPLVNLNDSINDYFETNPFIDTDGTKIYPTLLQFASHYSGGAPHGGASYTLDQFKSLLANFNYLNKPGTVYKYASGSTIAANVVASEYYGNKFPEKRVNDLLQEHLFSTLGMNSTKLHGWIDPALQDRMVLSHRFNGAPGSFRSVPTSGINLGGPSGCITSTAVDMMRLAAFIMGDGVPAGSEVLWQAAAAGIGWNKVNRSVPNTAFTPNASNAEKLGGWFEKLLGRPSNSGRYGRTLHHGGRIEGYHESSMRMCPDTKTAVIVLVNNAPARGSLSEQIMDRALNATYSGDSTLSESYTEYRESNNRPPVREPTLFNNFDDLVETYAGANGNVDIVLEKDFTIELPMNNIRAPAKAGATLTIRSADSNNPVTLTRGISGDMFSVPYGATLVFKNIIIDGGKIASDGSGASDGSDGAFADNGGGTLVKVNSGGKFIMEDGAVLRNNANLVTNGDGGAVAVLGTGTFTMNGGEISGNTAARSGGGVRISSSEATFTMNAGKISGNTSGVHGGGVNSSGAFTLVSGDISGNRAEQSSGGIHNAGAASTFTMTGGKISGNTAGTTAGGLRVEGTSIMNGGEISGNTAVTNGGGVMVNGSSAVFTMKSGEISGNTTGTEGGGFIISGGTITMSGGEISGNNATTAGGGIRISGGSFTIQNGKINGNKATSNGGGISALSSAVITIIGGEINGNSINGTTCYGGGISTFNSVEIIMNGGTINGNSIDGTTCHGGGVYNGSTKSFTMNGGEINGNTSKDYGGGVFNTGSSASFIMTGGKINGNTSSAGGGVVCNSGTFTMTGGEISGNTANSGAKDVRSYTNGTFNSYGGVVAGTGSALTSVVGGTGTYNFNTASPNNAVVIAWNRASGTLNYTDGETTNLIVSSGGTATWLNQGGVLGISYKNGSNTGWIKQW